MISRKQIVILLLLNTIIFGCVKYDFHTPQLNNDTLPNSCAGIIDTIQNHWQKHKKYNLYQYDDERYIFQLIVDYKQCFTQLDTNAVRQLLGEPSKSEHSRLFYHIDEKCLNIEKSLSCTFIFFESKNGKVTDIQHGSQEIINCY